VNLFALVEKAMSPNPTLQSLVDALSAIPHLEGEMRREFASIRETLATKPRTSEQSDGWLDAKAAARYMGISQTTFDKYRYQTTPKIKGSKLDGKTLYKRSDLDTFIMLYELKSRGLA